MRCLIVKGKNSGQMGDVVYSWWVDETHGYNSMRESNITNIQKFIVIPHFDNCGSPRCLELTEDMFKILDI